MKRYKFMYKSGSKLKSYHGKERWAVEGIGVGLQGQSYAIPTMGGWEQLELYAKQFIDFARHYPEHEYGDTWRDRNTEYLNEAVTAIEALLSKRELEAYKKGYIDGGIKEITK
jgi:hypothetical protein